MARDLLILESRPRVPCRVPAKRRNIVEILLEPTVSELFSHERRIELAARYLRMPQHGSDFRSSRPRRGGGIGHASSEHPISDRRLDIKLLGSFVLSGKTGAIAALPKKARALLGYLAMQADQAVSREQLAALLWAESGGEQARRSLRECLMGLRTALGPAAASATLVTEGAAVRLDAARVDIDVRHFETLARSTQADDLLAASDLYRDEFLLDIHVASEPFAEWLSIERRRLASLASDVLYRLASAQAQAHQLECALDAARRLIAIDPLREDGHRLLVRLLAAAGQRSAALKQFAECAEILRRELGIAPEQDTRDLIEAIRSGQFVGPSSEQKLRTPSITTGVSESLPNKTSLAVIAFANLSGDESRNYFAEGMTEEITTMLGRVPWLFVVGSSATAPYRDGPSDIKRAGIDLGVRYLLRGSVRQSESHVRVVVQLLDTVSGGQVWAERFEGTLDDIFAIQDQIAGQASAKLAPVLQSIEIEHSQRKSTSSLTAYDLYLRALPRYRTTLEENKEAVRLLAQAIEIDPLYGAAYGLAARCYQFQRLFGWVIASDPRLQEGVRLARRAAEIGSNDSEALWMAGITLAQLAGEMEHGLALIDRSLSLNPNSASAWISSAFVLGEIGNAKTALEHFRNAQRLNPLDSMHHVQWLAAGFAHVAAGRYRDAAEAVDKALSARPSYTPAMRLKVSLCGLLGQRDEGDRWVRRLLADNPDASVNWFAIYWQKPLSHNPRVLAALVEGARRAGLPEGP